MGKRIGRNSSGIDLGNVLAWAAVGIFTTVFWSIVWVLIVEVLKVSFIDLMLIVVGVALVICAIDGVTALVLLWKKGKRKA